ncbi:hypothetical protein K439DRAFT_561448 [Ramaria rubella]|nr:hypothetical protein K439DRAFT_561448 [Ramaria rubella]
MTPTSWGDHRGGAQGLELVLWQRCRGQYVVQLCQSCVRASRASLDAIYHPHFPAQHRRDPDLHPCPLLAHHPHLRHRRSSGVSAPSRNRVKKKEMRRRKEHVDRKKDGEGHVDEAVNMGSRLVFEDRRRGCQFPTQGALAKRVNVGVSVTSSPHPVPPLRPTKRTSPVPQSHPLAQSSIPVTPYLTSSSILRHRHLRLHHSHHHLPWSRVRYPSPNRLHVPRRLSLSTPIRPPDKAQPPPCPL